MSAEQPFQDPDQNQQPDQSWRQPDQSWQQPDRDQSRQPDPVSIGSGLVFFLIGGAYLLASGGRLTVNAGWTLSMLALGLGLSGIVGAIFRSRRGDDRRD